MGEVVNQDMLTFLKGVLTVAVLLLLSTPLILMNVFQGNLSGPWIGFWGSFAGGILGTAGVIYVAHLQNIEQLKHLRTVEVNERDRLKNATLISMLQDYHELLEGFLSQVNVIDTKLITIYSRKKMITKLTFMIKVHTENINNEIIVDKNFLQSTDKNFERPLKSITDYNNIFKSIGLDVKDSSLLKNRELINDLYIVLEHLITLSDNIDVDRHKSDLIAIHHSLDDFIKFPKDDYGNTLPIGIILKPYNELIQWLNAEIEITNKNIILLLKELSSSKK